MAEIWKNTHLNTRRSTILIWAERTIQPKSLENCVTFKIVLTFHTNPAQQEGSPRRKYKLVHCNETNLLPHLRCHLGVLTSYTSLCLFLTEFSSLYKFYNSFVRIFLISRSVSHNNVVSLKNWYIAANPSQTRPVMTCVCYCSCINLIPACTIMGRESNKIDCKRTQYVFLSFFSFLVFCFFPFVWGLRVREYQYQIWSSR